MNLKLKSLPLDLTVCKLATLDQLDLSAGFFFVARTDEEISLVCETARVPENTLAREDGWRTFRVEEGPLDFSLVGILSRISAVLAENQIGIFAVSTFNTDYILVKKDNFPKAQKALISAGYIVI
jgi:hypothetical protein